MKNLKCILLVDDDEINNIIGYSLIKRLEITEKIHSATNGINAINFLRRYYMQYKTMPDIIILDIEMPVMDGLEFLKALNNLFFIGNHQTTIVFLTNYSVETNRLELKISEKYLVLEKPLREEKLIRILDHHQNITSAEWTRRTIKKLFEKAS